MTEEWPKIFDHCTPPPAPAELRAKTLSAIERELTRRRKLRWERAFEWSVAASLVLGIGLNTWLWRADGSHQIDIGGPIQPAPSVAEHKRREHDISHAKPPDRGADVVYGGRYQRLLQEISQGRIPKSL